MCARSTLPVPEAPRITHLVNLPRDLDADEGDLPPPRNLKRVFMERRYGFFIETMYANQTKTAIEIPIRYQDGRSGILRADVAVGRIPQLSLQEN